MHDSGWTNGMIAANEVRRDVTARISKLEAEVAALRTLLETEREISKKHWSEVLRLRDALGWTDGA